MIVLSAIKLHCKSGRVVNLNIYACLGKVIVRQTPFAIKHQHPSPDLFGKRKKGKKFLKRERETEGGGKRATDCVKLAALLKY